MHGPFGYQIEYSNIKFGLFYFTSIYPNQLASSLFITILYLEGWNFCIPNIFVHELLNLVGPDMRGFFFFLLIDLNYANKFELVGENN